MRATTVLILDGQTNQALACARSLGRAGHRVYVASHVRRPLAAWSRFAREAYPLPAQTPDAFAALRAWAAVRGVRWVLPLTERSCVLCNLAREAWIDEGIGIAAADDALLRQAFDKARTVEAAERCGVRVPPTRVAASLDECREAARELGFPCVVKPRFSNAWDGARFLPDLGPAYVADEAALERAALAGRQGDVWPLVQGWVPGQGKGVFALCDHGAVVAWFAHERLRDVRPSGSGSSLRRSAPLASRLREPAQALLAAMRWHGPAMVEFRDDGVSPPALIEVNGRFWGSLQLAVDAGVDFPRLWLELLAGERVTPRFDYAEGVVRRWVWGDVKRLAHIAGGAPAGFPGRWPTLGEGIRELLGPQPPGTRSETLQRDDPLPALGEWVQGIGEMISARRARRRERRASSGRRPEEPMDAPIRVLMITSEWPSPGRPRTTHFIKRQADFLQAAGVDVDVFHFRGAKRPGNYARAWWQVRKKLARGTYDLVHAQFGQSGALAIPRRLPLVVTFRGSDLHGLVGDDGRHTRKGRILQGVSRWVARHADAVIVVSGHMKALIDPSIEPTVIPSGLDLALFRPIPRDAARAHLGLPMDRRLLLFAGNPAQARKRFALAQAAVELLPAEWRADLVVGWGVPHDDMPYYMSACDALVFTSMQEGSPNVVKEALACNLPVVSVPVGDVAQRLAGIAGCELCDDDQPATIAAAIERVLRRGGRAASRESVAWLDETLLTQRVIDVYRTVMRREAPRMRPPATPGATSPVVAPAPADAPPSATPSASVPRPAARV